MRKRKYGAVFLCAAAVLLCMAVTVLYTMAFILPDDTKPPVISMASDVLEVSVTATDDELLAGVTAVDARDGDVTDSLLVEGMDGIADGRVRVTYAAFDRAGNVAKTVREVQYTDYYGPKFSLRAALVYHSGTSVEVLDRVAAQDLLDGNISRQVKANLVSDTGSLSQTGTHQVEFRVTNSLGDTSYLTLPVDVLAPGSVNAQVRLSEYMVYLPKGADFNARSYVKALTNSLGETITENRSEMDMSIESNVRTNVPGVYSVRYTVSYAQGMMQYTGYTRLVVVVED